MQRILQFVNENEDVILTFLIGALVAVDIALGYYALPAGIVTSILYGIFWKLSHFKVKVDVGDVVELKKESNQNAPFC